MSPISPMRTFRLALASTTRRRGQPLPAGRASAWSERCRSLASLGSHVGKWPTARNLDLFSFPLGSAALAHQGTRTALEADKRNLERIVLRIAAEAENDLIA